MYLISATEEQKIFKILSNINDFLFCYIYFGYILVFTASNKNL